MNLTLILGILLALGCAIAAQLGFLLKFRGANAAPKVDIRHPLASFVGLLRARLFLVGLLVAIFGWVLHVGALAIAPMSLVQAVLAGGVVILAVMAERLFGFEVGRRQWAGVGMTAVGLIALGATLPPVEGAHSSYSVAGMVAFESALLAAGALLIAGPRLGGPAEHHGVMLGAASGLLFGVSDIAIKAITGTAAEAGVLGTALSPWMAVMILASVLAFFASARGLQEGEAVPVIAVTGTAANVSCIAGGFIVFGDPLPGDVLGIVVTFAAFALVTVASALIPAPVRTAPGSATASA